MTANTTTSTHRVRPEGAVARRRLADRGCLAAMLGLALSDATASNAEEGSSFELVIEYATDYHSPRMVEAHLPITP